MAAWDLIYIKELPCKNSVFHQNELNGLIYFEMGEGRASHYVAKSTMKLRLALKSIPGN